MVCLTSSPPSGTQRFAGATGAVAGASSVPELSAGAPAKADATPSATSAIACRVSAFGPMLRPANRARRGPVSAERNLDRASGVGAEFATNGRQCAADGLAERRLLPPCWLVSSGRAITPRRVLGQGTGAPRAFPDRPGRASAKVAL